MPLDIKPMSISNSLPIYCLTKVHKNPSQDLLQYLNIVVKNEIAENWKTQFKKGLILIIIVFFTSVVGGVIVKLHQRTVETVIVIFCVHTDVKS